MSDAEPSRSFCDLGLKSDLVMDERGEAISSQISIRLTLMVDGGTFFSDLKGPAWGKRQSHLGEPTLWWWPFSCFLFLVSIFCLVFFWEIPILSEADVRKTVFLIFSSFCSFFSYYY